MALWQTHHSSHRRSKRKRFSKKILTILLILALAVISYFTEPWQYLGGGELQSQTNAAITDLQVHYLDVGQADSILIQVPVNGKTKNILIDAGSSETSKDADLESLLIHYGVEELEYFIITHPHTDHDGSADMVIKKFKINNVILPECLPGLSNTTWLRLLEKMDEKGLTYIPAKAGDTYKVGDASFKILGPVDVSALVKSSNDFNNYSVVLRLTYGSTHFMFTGDAERESEAQILQAFSKGELACDVLKAGHHGSRTSSSAAFLKAVNPSIAIISCGKDNDYGHPHKETITNMKSMNITMLRTDKIGTITICSDKTRVYQLTNDQ